MKKNQLFFFSFYINILPAKNTYKCNTTTKNRTKFWWGPVVLGLMMIQTLFYFCWWCHHHLNPSFFSWTSLLQQDLHHQKYLFGQLPGGACLSLLAINNWLAAINLSKKTLCAAKMSSWLGSDAGWTSGGDLAAAAASKWLEASKGLSMACLCIGSEAKTGRLKDGGKKGNKAGLAWPLKKVGRFGSAVSLGWWSVSLALYNESRSSEGAGPVGSFFECIDSELTDDLGLSLSWGLHRLGVDEVVIVDELLATNWGLVWADDSGDGAVVVAVVDLDGSTPFACCIRAMNFKPVGSPSISWSWFGHSHHEAFFQTTCLTCCAIFFVDYALVIVLAFLNHGLVVTRSTEERFATFACKCSKVKPSCWLSTYFASLVLNGVHFINLKGKMHT